MGKITKLTGIAKSIWDMLPEETKEAYYYDTGTFGFLENVVILCYESVTDDDYEKLHDQVFGG
jgi:hypothetical protein